MISPNPAGASRARAGSQPRVPVDGHRHYVTFIVIGVAAHQIDPARRPDDQGGRSVEGRLEGGNEMSGRSQGKGAGSHDSISVEAAGGNNPIAHRNDHPILSRHQAV